MKLNFNHHVRELLEFGIGLEFKEEINNKIKLKNELLRKSYKLKTQLEKLNIIISKERKLYRKNYTNEKLININKYENEYKQIYNSYLV